MAEKNHISIAKESINDLTIKFMKLFMALNKRKGLGAGEQILVSTPIGRKKFNISGWDINLLDQAFHNKELFQFIEQNPEIELTQLRVYTTQYAGIFLECVDFETAKIVFDPSSGKPLDGDTDFRFIVYSEIKNIFQIVSEAEALRKLSDNKSSAVIAAYAENIENLQNISSNLITTFAKQQQALESDFQERRRILDDEIRQKKSQIEQEHNEKIASLQSQIAEFESDKKAFDDRKNTHARRQLLGRMEAILNERTSSNFSQETIDKYKAAEALLSRFALGIFSISGIWLSLFIYSYIRETVYYAAMAAASATLIAGSLVVIWLIKLRLKWYGTHTQFETSNRRFIMNMLRASWVVEMYYEWKSERGTEMDKTLTDRLTVGLFTESDSQGTIQHPAEELINAIAKIKKIKVNKDGLEIEK